MATSTIIENITINNPKFLEAYVEHLEKLEREPIQPNPPRTTRDVTDPKEIEAIMRKCIENWGKK